MSKKSASTARKGNSAQNQSSENFSFQAEVNRLLNIVTHALYSDQDVFIRELVSNAADACDKLRTLALTNKKLAKKTENLHINIHVDPLARRITIHDNGIGMNREELIENLGTIAHSGTAAFSEMLEQAVQNKKKGKNATATDEKPQEAQFIGQFGVGFYAAFMVADHVRVISRKADEKESYIWESNGQDGYRIALANPEQAAMIQDNSTAIILDLKEGCEDFARKDRVGNAVHKYSDHIGFPIFITEEGSHKEPEQLNEAAALWTLPKNKITEEQYQNFYRHNGGYDMPFHTIHWHAEGVIDYTALLFIPSMRPFDLYDPKKRHNVKLYVRRVFISESPENLVPPWLRFIRGIVDSADLPLNINRETLQANPVLAKIRQSITRKALSELEKKAKDKDAFRPFWQNFGAVLKEGLYEAGDFREKILELCRFHSSALDEFDLNGTTLEEYINRMQKGQDTIYYMIGEDLDQMRTSPQLEAFIDQNVEVLLMNDTIDAFWIEQISDYQGKKFQSVTKGSPDLPNAKEEKKQEAAKESSPENKNEKDSEKPDPFLEALAKYLKEDIKTVRTSKRLKNSLACLVADQHDIDMRTEQLLRAHQGYDQQAQRILEVNTNHPLITTLIDKKLNDAQMELLAQVLFDQARIQEGEKPKNANHFAKNMTRLLEMAFHTDHE